VSPQWITLVERTPSQSSHLKHYHEIDIALDPFPYNGTTTTCEALWMGVPVVALNGNRHSGRVSASLLTSIGATDLIGGDIDEYIRIAVRLARDRPHLAKLKGALREQMAVSRLCDASGFARKIERAFRLMWRRWCEETPNSAD
jgi:protein O-GlcNAc transferase